MSSRRNGVSSSTPNGAPALRCWSCLGSTNTAFAGLFAVRDLFADRRVISPSRFGYLSSSLPSNATVAAQADAFVALLDALDIGQIDVIGFSAGATSALQLALRHPKRVKHLVVLVGNLPGSPTAVVQPSWAKRIDRQLIMWALKTLAPSTTARLVAAVPKAYAMTSEDVRYVTEFIDSLFPLSPEGYIPGARFVSLESGGHLMLGQTTYRDELESFLAEKGDRRAERVAS